MKKNITILILGFFILSACSNDGYRIEDRKVVYERPWNEGFGTVIDELNADPKTFEILGRNNMIWAKDKDHVYMEGILLDFMDSKSLTVLSDDFAKDEKKVVCRSKVINEADIDTFEIKKILNSEGKLEAYGVDMHSLYKCGGGYIRYESIYSDSFTPLKDNFFKDKVNVFWSNKKLPAVVIPQKFKVLKGGYGTDGINIYFHHKLVKGVDPETFEVISNFRAKDKNHQYEFEERIE